MPPGCNIDNLKASASVCLGAEAGVGTINCDYICERKNAGSVLVIAIAAADTLLNSVLNPDQLQQCNWGGKEFSTMDRSPECSST